MKPRIRVGIDVGSESHRVGIASPEGELLEEFSIPHCRQGFERFFERVERHRRGLGVAVAMEGYGGHARPLEGEILKRGYELLNVNNLKLARFREVFPAPAKSDHIDARLILNLFCWTSICPSPGAPWRGCARYRRQTRSSSASPAAGGTGQGEGAGLQLHAIGSQVRMPRAFGDHRIGRQPVVPALPRLPGGLKEARPPATGEPA